MEPVDEVSVLGVATDMGGRIKHMIDRSKRVASATRLAGQSRVELLGELFTEIRLGSNITGRF
jgi:hypothetical protein